MVSCLNERFKLDKRKPGGNYCVLVCGLWSERETRHQVAQSQRNWSPNGFFDPTELTWAVGWEGAAAGLPFRRCHPYILQKEKELFAGEERDAHERGVFVMRWRRAAPLVTALLT